MSYYEKKEYQDPERIYHGHESQWKFLGRIYSAVFAQTNFRVFCLL